MARSMKLAQMFRDAASGLRDSEIEEITGLSFPTWQRMKSGLIVSDEKITQFCDALGIDAEPFLQEAWASRPKTDVARAITTIVLREGLDRADAVRIVALFRELQERRAETAA